MISFFLYSLFFLSSSTFFIPHVLDSFTMLSFLLVSFSLCIVISSLFTSLRSFHLSSIRQIPLFASMCACLRGRGSTRASEREYFVYSALSQFFEFCGPPSARFLFLFSLRSRKPPGVLVSNGNRRSSTVFVVFVHFRLFTFLFF